MNQTLKWPELVHGNSVEPCQVMADEVLAFKPIFLYVKLDIFFPAFGFAAMPWKCPGCVSPMKVQMWDLVGGALHQRHVQGRKLLALVTEPLLHRAIHVGPQPVPCSLPAKTQLKLITYQEYQHPHKACAGWRRRLSLSPFFFPFRPA